MTPGGVWCLGNDARNRFKGRGIPTCGTHLLVGILVLSACTATTRAQGGGDNNSVEPSSSNETAVPFSSGKPPNCFVAPEAGPCRGKLYRYYFHWGVGQCYRYTYSGCGGTGNNFRSKQRCMRTCWPLNYHMYCRTEVEQGPCQSWSVRYYFSAEKNHCFPFYYSGCGGNLNNFRSEQECRAICIAE
ncbi:hypothetical protein MTO96_034602 [Rhipicephalus appendiculatus]|uniref:Tissue factor pathway inhibitor n=1 Tax=Rhipicephalus appendiculatus TaxID=34631 RepID=A0A131Z1K2_RHIAP